MLSDRKGYHKYPYIYIMVCFCGTVYRSIMHSILHYLSFMCTLLKHTLDNRYKKRTTTAYLQGRAVVFQTVEGSSLRQQELPASFGLFQ